MALVVVTTATIYAQRPKTARPPTRAAATDIFAFVPKSDGIVVVDVKRLLNETLPNVFAGDSAKLAQINSEIDKF